MSSQVHTGGTLPLRFYLSFHENQQFLHLYLRGVVLSTSFKLWLPHDGQRINGISSFSPTISWVGSSSYIKPHFPAGGTLELVHAHVCPVHYFCVPANGTNKSRVIRHLACPLFFGFLFQRTRLPNPRQFFRLRPS